MRHELEYMAVVPGAYQGNLTFRRQITTNPKLKNEIERHQKSSQEFAFSLP